MARSGRGGFKKRYLLLAVVVFLGAVMFRHQLPDPIGPFGIAFVEGLKDVISVLKGYFSF